MLSEIWETYAQNLRRLSEKDNPVSIKKRQDLLDRFLCLFIKESSCRDDTLLSSELKNVSNELSQEFMRNILSVTNNAAEDDVSSLEHYLLAGHGWKLLYVIHRIGVQGVYNRYDLCNLLLTLLPFCLKMQPKEAGNILKGLIGVSGQVPVSRCFQFMDHAPKHKHGHLLRSLKAVRSGSGLILQSGVKKERKHFTKSVSTKGTIASKESDDDSDEKKSKRPRLKKSLRTHIWAPPVKDEDSGSEDDSPGVFGSDELEVTEVPVSSSDLFRLILHLLQDLAEMDMQSTGASQVLSATVLPVLLDVLLSFSSGKGLQHCETEEISPVPWQRETGLLLLQQLLRLILTASGVVATQQSGVRTLLHQKVVPGILASLAYCHLPDADAGKCTVLSDVELLEMSIIQDGVCGCLNLFQIIFSHLPFNPSFIRDANAAMELFRHHNGEDYFHFLFLQREKLLLENKIKKGDGHVDPIKWLCSLIHCLKEVKVSYVHAIKCLKRRHRNCEYGTFFHHHHDIFGTPLELILPQVDESSGVQMKLADPSSCQMAKWSCLLLDCLRKTQARSSRIQILSVLRGEGVCCCLQPASIVNVMLPLISIMSPAVRNYALETMNTMLLEQFHGGAEADVASKELTQCCVGGDVHVGVPDSGFTSSGLVDQGKQHRLRWRSLRLLRQYILSGPDGIALALAKNLITLAIQGNSDIKEELFFGIYLHILNMKVEQSDVSDLRSEDDDVVTPVSTDLSSGEDGAWIPTVPNSVMLHCVSSLPYVLQADKVMHLFLDKGGLTCLTHLLDNDQLRAPVMGVFEALIMIDEQAVISKTISDQNVPQTVEYNGGIVIQTFIDTLARKTCAITAAFQQLQLQGPPGSDCQFKKGDSEYPSVTPVPVEEQLHMGNDIKTEENICSVDHIHEHILATLPALQDMWKTCAKLCMNSHTFRACYRNSPCLYIVQETLVLALTIMSDLSFISSLNSVSTCSSEASMQRSEKQDVSAGHHSSLTCHLSKLAFIEAVMIVCFSCHTISPLQKEGEEEEMWLRLKQTLQQCVELEPSKLRAVFDMLLNAAQPQLPSILEYSYAQITSSLSHQDIEELTDEDVVRKLMQHGSEEELDSLYTEDGYQADTESNLQEDWQQGFVGTAVSGRSNKQTMHCFPAVLRLFVELLVASQHTVSGQAVLIPVMLRLLHMLRTCRTIASAACKQGLLARILSGFRSTLVQPSAQEHNKMLYSIVLTMIQVLGQVEISSSELGHLFKLFLVSEDINSLLSTLTCIVENSWIAPHAYLSFPVKTPVNLVQNVPHPLNSQHDDKESGIQAGAWNLSAGHCEVHGLQWPPLETGFSLAFWMNLSQVCLNHLSGEHSSRQTRGASAPTVKANYSLDGHGDEAESVFGPLSVPFVRDCLHLVSLGDSVKAFEIWLHASTATLLCRLTSAYSDSMVLKETGISTGFGSFDWHHVAVSYIDQLDGSTSVGKLVLTFDGLLHHEVILDHPASVWHTRGTSSTPILSFGHRTGHRDKHHVHSYSLGPVMLFADSSLSREWWFHLYALGPSCGGIGKCDCESARVSYDGLLTRHVIECGLNQDVLSGTSPVPDMDKARMAQVLLFDPEIPSRYCSFHQVPRKGPGSLLGLVPSVSSIDPLLLQKLSLQPVTLSAAVKASTHSNFPDALEQLGSLQALLFLVAKVVEKRNHVETGDNDQTQHQLQCKAVHLLLAVVHHFPPLTLTFTQMQGYDTLSVILKASRAVAGYPLLKVLFDAATTESVFKSDNSTNRLVLRKSTESTIRNVAVISQLLLCWQIWKRDTDQFMELILATLVLLVGKDHPHRTFNIKQMQAGGIVKVLFHIYLDRIQDDLPSLSACCGQFVTVLVSSIVGHPPDLGILASVTDFLMQVHPATSGFINSTQSAFYLYSSWLSGEEQSTRLANQKKRELPDLKKTHKASDHSLSASDTGSDMERMQFHVGPDSSEACWESMEGSDDSDHGVNRNRSESLLGKKSPYPLLETTAAMPAHSYFQEDSSDVSSDPSHQQSGSTSESGPQPLGKNSGQKKVETASQQQQKSHRRGNQHRITQVSSPLQSKHTEYAIADQEHDQQQSSVSQADADRSTSHKPSSMDSTKPADGDDSKDRLTNATPTDCLAFANDQHDENLDTKEGLEMLSVCLLQYLHKVVMEYPNEGLDEVFCHVVSPHVLLVLAQSPSDSVRIAVTKLLGAYLWRAPVSLVEEFLKEDGFCLLANQLSAFPVCQQQMEAAFSLLLSHTFTFQDHYMLGGLGQVSELQQSAPILPLSLLSRTASDTALCHNTLAVFSQLIDGTPVMSKVLVDLGLPEVLCNLLHAVHHRHTGSVNNDGVDRVQLLLLDVQSIFCTTAVSLFSWSGGIHFHEVEYLFSILQAMEDREKCRDEKGLKLAETARALQFAMVVRVLECVQHMSEEFSKTTSSSLSSQSVGTFSTTALWHTKPWLSSPSTSTQTLPAATLAGTSTFTSFSQSSSVYLRTTHSSPEMSFLLDVEDQYQSREAVEGVLEMVSTKSSMQVQRISSDEGKQSLLQRLFNRKKKLEYSRISQSELLERFRKFLALSVDLATLQEREEKVKPQTQHMLNFLAEPATTSLNDRFLKHLFTTLYQFLASTLIKDSFQKRTRNTFMSSAKDILRVQFGRVLLCILTPRMDFELRIFTVSFLMGENLGCDVVRLLAGSQHVVGSELGLYLHDLVSVWREWLNPSQRDLALSLLSLLRQCGCYVNSFDRPIHPEHTEALREEIKTVEARFQRERQAWINRRAASMEKVQRRFADTVKRVSDHAMEVTQVVAAQQGRERACLVEHIKQNMALQIQLKKSWQDIVQSLTHERGVWHHAESYPRSWELDPTEGPGRIRRRLMQCHLGISAKYLLPEYHSKLACQERDAPLQYVFEDDHQIADSATLVYQLFHNDTVLNTFICTAVSPASESKGELLMGEQFLYFVADKAITDTDYTQMLLGNKDQMVMMWCYTELLEVHSRWYQLQDNAVEMFLITGRTHLLAFATTFDRDKVLHLLLQQLDKPKGFEQTAAEVQKMWTEGTLTNFDYLTCLNKLAGRSFSDLMQYPVFPFVLRDYDSEELNLEDPSSFRDLRKPIAVQDKSRERKYIDNYEFLRQEMMKPGPEEVMRVEPFHYGSHYSNSGTVLHYLVRLPPFTRMFLAYQDQSFDIPDRTFHSIRTSWRLSSFDSSTDVKELIPEFFFLPEFLTNNEGFDFGCRQSGERVDDVLLPPWCHGNPRLFVLINRQALESALTTQTLHHWIDLVFGFKQKGEEAVKAINVFHPSTYFGMDVNSVTDPVKRQALLTMIRTYGQTPRQLFFGPHPPPTHSLASVQHGSATGQQEKRTYVPRPIASVNGLRWGSYVGSPEMPQPVCHQVTQLDVPVASLVPLVTGPVFGIESYSALITLHTKPADVYNRPTDVMWAGAVTWNHPDGILRVITHNNKPLITFIPPNPYDTATCCVAALDRCVLFVAAASGNISVFNMTHNISKPTTLHVWGLRRMLCGHKGAVNVMQVCKAFGVVVSGSQDTTVMIWDLNRLSYVRTLSDHQAPVVAIAVSPTLGDIASVSHSEGCSQMWVHTINGREVGQYSCDSLITCLAYSSAPEGQSINVIAGGLRTGVVRLWSSWDVTHLRDLLYDSSAICPILSLAYSANSQVLFVSSSDGNVVMWQHDPPSTPGQASLFMPILRHASDRH